MGAGRIFALPLMILALLFQVGAPVSAARAAAAMADPFAQIVICSPNKEAGNRTGGEKTPGHHQNHLCGLCAVCWASVGPAADEVRLAFAPAPSGSFTASLPSAVSARGPPGRLPPATGPPLTI